MSTRAQSQIPLDAYLAQDVAFNYEMLGTIQVPRNHVYTSGPQMLTSTTERHFCRSYAGEHPTPEHAPLAWHGNQVYTGVSTHAHVNQHTQYNPLLWSPPSVQMVSEPLPIPSSLAVVETLDVGMTSASGSAYDPDLYGTSWGSHTALDPYRTPQSHLSDRSPIQHPIAQETRNLGYHLPSESSVYRTPSYATHFYYSSLSNDQNVADSLTQHHLPSLRSYNPSLLHQPPHPTPTGHPKLDPGFLPVTLQHPADSSRRRRGARAIEYDGLWIDEEELLGGLMEPDGKLDIHQCLWDKDCSPCHLWVKNDKSCISTHIQKWHGGRMGGDKLEVHCRWSACGKTMLKESIARHVLSIHLGEMWECQGCGKMIARKDAYERHAAKSDIKECQNAGALVAYSVDVRAIDARAAPDGGGRKRYADA